MHFSRKAVHPEVGNFCIRGTAVCVHVRKEVRSCIIQRSMLFLSSFTWGFSEARAAFLLEAPVVTAGVNQSPLSRASSRFLYPYLVHFLSYRLFAPLITPPLVYAHVYFLHQILSRTWACLALYDTPSRQLPGLHEGNAGSGSRGVRQRLRALLEVLGTSVDRLGDQRGRPLVSRQVVADSSGEVS